MFVSALCWRRILVKLKGGLNFRKEIIIIEMSVVGGGCAISIATISLWTCVFMLFKVCIKALSTDSIPSDVLEGCYYILCYLGELLLERLIGSVGTNKAEQRGKAELCFSFKCASYYAVDVGIIMTLCADQPFILEENFAMTNNA